MKLKIFCRCSFSFLVRLRTYQHLCPFILHIYQFNEKYRHPGPLSPFSSAQQVYNRCHKHHPLPCFIYVYYFYYSNNPVFSSISSAIFLLWFFNLFLILYKQLPSFVSSVTLTYFPNFSYAPCSLIINYLLFRNSDLCLCVSIHFGSMQMVASSLHRDIVTYHDPPQPHQFSNPCSKPSYLFFSFLVHEDECFCFSRVV